MSLLVAFGPATQGLEFTTATSWPTGVSIDTGVYRTAASGKHGNCSLKCSKSTAATVYYILRLYGATGAAADMSSATTYITYNFYYPGTPQNTARVGSLRNASAGLWWFSVATNGKLYFYDSASTQLSATSNALSVGWHTLQIYSKVQTATTGLWTLSVDNGGTAVTVSSGTTANFATTAATMLYVGSNTTETQSPAYDLHFADITVSDSGFTPPDSVCGLLKAAGDSGANTGYTASSGTKYGCVGEGPPPSDTNFINSAVNNAIYTATLTQCSTIMGASDVIVAVVPLASHGNHPSGGTTKLASRLGSTNYVFGTGVADAPGNDAFLGHVYELDPAGNPWTQDNLNAYEVGVQNGSASGTSNCNEVYASVLFYTPPGDVGLVGPGLCGSLMLGGGLVD